MSSDDKAKVLAWSLVLIGGGLAGLIWVAVWDHLARRNAPLASAPDDVDEKYREKVQTLPHIPHSDIRTSNLTTSAILAEQKRK